MIVGRPQKSEWCNERPCADTCHHLEFRPVSGFAPACQQTGAKGAILTATGFGILFFYRLSASRRTYHPLTLLGFGLALALQGLLWTVALPVDVAWRAFRIYALPVTLFYPIGTLLIGSLLADDHRHRQTRKALEASEERLRIHPRDARRLGVRTAYGLLTASAWLPLLQAYLEEPGTALTALVWGLATMQWHYSVNGQEQTQVAALVSVSPHPSSTLMPASRKNQAI